MDKRAGIWEDNIWQNRSLLKLSVSDAGEAGEKFGRPANPWK